MRIIDTGQAGKVNLQNIDRLHIFIELDKLIDPLESALLRRARRRQFDSRLRRNGFPGSFRVFLLSPVFSGNRFFRLGGFLRIFFLREFHEIQENQVILRLLDPEQLQLRAVRRPRRLRPVHIEFLVCGQVGFLFEILRGKFFIFFKAFHEKLEHIEGKLDISHADLRAELFFLRFKRLDVLRREKHARRVQRFEIIVKELR